MKKLFCAVWIFMTICFFSEIACAETTTNIADGEISTEAMKIVDDAIRETPDKKWTLFKWVQYKIPENEMENFDQRFGNLTKILSTKAMLSDERSGGQKWVESRGERWFTDTGADSMVEGFLAWFDLDRFNRPGNSASEAVTRFAYGSLAPDEGRLHPDTINPEGALSIYGWIGSFFKNDRTKYGVNVFNDKPYVFYARAFWENGNGSPFVIMDVRLRFDPLLASPRLDGNALFPINHLTQLIVGGKMYPTRSDHKRALVVKLSRQLDNQKDKNVIYIAGEFDEHETFCFFEVSLSNIFGRYGR